MSRRHTGDRTLIEEIVILGTYNWVTPGDVLSETYEFETENDELRRTMAFGSIAELLVGGLMIPGSVSGRQFVAWDRSVGDSIAAIVTRWLAEWGTAMPDADADIWLSNTEAGSALAASVIAREPAASE